MDKKLLTAIQVAEEYNFPSAATVNRLRSKGLTCLKIGKGYLYDRKDVEAFIESKKETKCHDEIEVATCGSLKNATHTTSNGANSVPSKNVAQALQTIEKLRQNSQSL